MDNINVVIRVRPLLTDENSTVEWETEENAIYQTDQLQKPYNFNRVFDLSTVNEDVFEEVARPILDSVMQGYNGSIFAYGQTASGKTHTMMGSARDLGLIPRMINAIFDAIRNTPDRGFLLRVSYAEIYNDRVYDLLSGGNHLAVRENTNGETFVENLKIEVVSSMMDIITQMRIGEKNRTNGATASNPNSSRSHAIFRIIIESGVLSNKDVESRIISSNDLWSGDADLFVSHLNLVDLAGSEKTGQMASGAGNFREGCSINKSLLALRNVISQLSQNKEGSFINYRDSNLTKILKSSLGGNAKTSIICTVNPSTVYETRSTLKFASVAKSVRNAPKKNVFVSDAVKLKQYAREIADLQSKLQTRSKQSLDQETLKQQLKETELKNKELEEKITKLKDCVITSSALNRANRRLRRASWGGFEEINFVAPSTPQKSLAYSKLYRTSCSLRTLPSQFGTGKEEARQTRIATDLEKKLTAIEEQHRFMEKDCQEQIEYLELEYGEIENENRKLNLENDLLKKRIGELEDKTNFSTLRKTDCNCTGFHESLGLIPNIEKHRDGLLLPWSEDEMLEKVSKLEAELEVQRLRASAAEDQSVKLRDSSEYYRRESEKTIDDLTIESVAAKNCISNLQTELEKNIEDRQTKNREHATLLTRLKDKNNKIQFFKEQIEVLGKNVSVPEHEELKKHLNESEKLVENLRKSLKYYEEKIKELRNNLKTNENWKIKCQEAQTKSVELENLAEYLSTRLTDCEDDMQLLKEQIDMLVPEHEELKKHLNESEKLVENLRKSLKYYEEKMKELRTNLKTNEKWKIKFQESQTISDELKNVAQTMSTLLTDKDGEIQFFKEQIETLGKNVSVPEHEELKKHLTESEKEVKNLRKSLKMQECEIKTLRGRLVERAENTDHLEKQLKENENQLMKLNLESEIKIRELEAVSAALEVETNTTQQLTEKLREQLDANIVFEQEKKKEFDIYRRLHCQLLKEHENEKSNYQKKISFLEGDVQRHKNSYQRLESELVVCKILNSQNEEIFSKALAQQQETIAMQQMDALKTKAVDVKSYEIQNKILTNANNFLKVERSRLEKQLGQCQCSANSTALPGEDLNRGRNELQ